MKKSCLMTLLSLFCVLASVSAGDFKCKIEPLLSVYYGMVNEYVYVPTGSANYKLSHLAWDVKPLWTGGAQADFSWRNLRISGRISGGISGKSGKMADFDWLNIYYLGMPLSISQQQITNYSNHNAVLNNFLQWGAEISYKFKPHRTVSLSPFVSFTSRSFDWTAIGGFIQYSQEYFNWDGRSSLQAPLPAWSPGSSWKKQAVGGSAAVISYEQYVQYFSLGLRAEYRPVERWSLSGLFSVAPYVFATAYDRHWLGTRSYLDIMGGSFALAAEIKSNYRITSWLELCLSIGWDFMGLCLGPDFIQDVSDPQIFNALYSQRKNPMGAWALLNRLASGSSLKYSALGGASQNLLSATLSLAVSF